MNLSTTKLYLLLFLASTFAFISCTDDSDPAENLTVKETIAGNNDLSDITDALSTTGLDTTLSDEGPVTLFAPANNAFPQDSLSGDELEAALKYHIVAMNLTFDNMQELESAVTLSGDSLFFSFENDTVTINGQAIIITDGIEASNGRVFVIDTLLTPPEPI